jgi:hypothetical protein
VYTGVPPDGRLTRGVLVDGSVLAARAAPAAEQAKVVAVTPAAAAASMILVIWLRISQILPRRAARASRARAALLTG